jgi:hypothetical protein
VHSSTRVLRTMAALASLALVATACSDDGGEATPAPEQPAGPLADALATLPASTELVRFVDRTEAEARLGIDDLEALDSPAAVKEYEGARMSAEWAFSELGGFAEEMSTKGAFSELDVQWEARGALPDEKGRLDGWAVFRLEDELDLDAVADAMVEAGYTERELDGRRHLTAPAPDKAGMVDGTYPFGLLDRVTVVPDEHLLVTGGAGPVLDVLDGTGPSLADDGKLAEVAQPAPGVEHAELRTAVATDCSAPLAGAEEVAPATLKGAWTALGMDGLRKPEASALYVVTSEEESTPPVRGVTLLQFADEATAAADAEARSAWLLEGTDQVTRLSMRQLYTPVGEVVVDGSRVAVEWTYGRNMAAGVRAHQAGAGIASCAELG